DDFGAQAFQGLLARRDDVLRAEFVTEGRIGIRIALLTDATFRGDHDPLAHAGHLLEGFAENIFCNAVAINVRMVEKRIARFIRSQNRLNPLPFSFASHCRRVPRPSNPPTTVRETANLERTFTESDRLHFRAADI